MSEIDGVADQLTSGVETLLPKTRERPSGRSRRREDLWNAWATVHATWSSLGSFALQPHTAGYDSGISKWVGQLRRSQEDGDSWIVGGRRGRRGPAAPCESLVLTLVASSVRNLEASTHCSPFRSSFQEILMNLWGLESLKTWFHPSPDPDLRIPSAHTPFVIIRPALKVTVPYPTTGSVDSPAILLWAGGLDELGSGDIVNWKVEWRTGGGGVTGGEEGASELAPRPASVTRNPAGPVRCCAALSR